MRTRQLGSTNLHVFPLCLGGNVFGWTADEPTSFDVLDAYAAAGGNFIDTADAYSAWVPGHAGGESETVIGNWMASRANRSRMIIATKVGRHPQLKGLAPETIMKGVDDSLRRLRTDYIDLYYAHADDPDTPLLDTLRTFDMLVRSGKVRHVAASNYTAPRLAEALETSDREGLTSYVALQPHYNLVFREEYEGPLRDLCAARNLACLPYFALGAGFLTGKYRPGMTVQSARAGGASRYRDARGERTLVEVEQIANARGTTIPAVALAWLLQDSTIPAPIASARTVAQLADLLPSVELELTAEESNRLRQVSTL